MVLIKNQRGSALLEAVGVTSALSVLAVATLVTAYFLFVRAWMQYQSEQALYCVAEGRPAVICQRDIQRRVSNVLIFGRSHAVVTGLRAQTWRSQLFWEWNLWNIRLEIKKQLSNARILKIRDSP